MNALRSTNRAQTKATAKAHQQAIRKPFALQRGVFMSKLVIIILLLIVIAFLLRLAIGYFSASQKATGLVGNGADVTLEPCDGSFRCASSIDTNERNQLAPLDYTSSAEEVINAYSELIAAQPGASIVSRSERYLHATFKTRFLGFTDDLELLLDDANVLQVRSASRLGKSDLGVNRKRIETLRAAASGKT